ncbi:ribosome-associated ATPase/putative transporter RbbA [Thioalkalivibrio sp.]|uniref:ribosome-associated ATPase/putative transporter RbbA n=1 Tax=Thioalkalivibrio sp. TaxID=2093813 RepID=UPI00356A03D0
MEQRSRPAVIELSGVSHRYGDSRALDDVTLRLPAGRISGLVGADGAGKSTLLGLAAGVRRAQQGQLQVLGADLREPGQRKGVGWRIAYMPQGLGRNLYATLSVRENLDFFGRLFGQDRQTRSARIAELTEATGLAEFVERPVMQLSGGMKQKLGLCCALIHDPDLVILDEPTTGVDPLSRRRFWDFIDRLRQRRPGMSIVIATAYMEEADRFDHLVAMDGGRVLAADTPDALREKTGADAMEQVFIRLLPEGRGSEGRQQSGPPGQPEEAGSPAIEARGLTRRFGDFTAVDRVSLTIRKGEIFGFVGSNGSGKTTTMRMLTGLLPASAGEAFVFGKPVDQRDSSLRHRLGFMSQSFSLYDELTVGQNLDLHARLYGLNSPRRSQRIQRLAERFDLEPYMNQRAEQLPLGLRQRLSLAVAMIHEPELLILDEPTSGVGPDARDDFWALLTELSRDHGVTLFVSTHFMNEAERCDRISLMHAGRVLAQGSPAELCAAQDTDSLDDAFITYIEQETGEEKSAERETGGYTSRKANSMPPASDDRAGERPRSDQQTGKGLSPGRLWAYTRREAVELRREPIRLAFALLGPLLLMIAMGYGISFDVEDIRYAVLDYDRSPASRHYLDGFAGSTYFERQPEIGDHAELTRRLVAGDVTLAIEIPPGFGRALAGGDPTEVGVWIDGSVPMRGDTIRGYVEGVHRHFVDSTDNIGLAAATRAPVEIETRFRYNQSFESIYAMVPAIMMLLLIMIPATMTAVGVVREKELGSITNYYATPTRGIEFLLGKQLPYVGLALLGFVLLLLQALLLFRLPLQGSLAALSLGALLFVFASTGLGLLMSTFMRSQIAAIFATAIVSTIPTILFSGMLVPVSSLTGPAHYMGLGFPSAWFHHVSVGTFTKGLGLHELWPDFLVLAAFGIGFVVLGRLLLRGQER